MACCSCNGVNARCIRCACVKRKKPCLDCLPQRSGTCRNTVSLRQEQAAKGTDTVLSSSVLSSSPVSNNGSTQVGNDGSNSPCCRSNALARGVDRNEVIQSPNSPCATYHTTYRHLSPLTSNCHYPNASAVESYPHGEPNIEELVNTAFGSSLIQSQGSDSSNVWHRRWLSVVHLSGKLYDIPGGSVGRKYVDSLTQEVSHLSSGNYPSDRVIVFSSVILQRDRMVRKGQDVRRVLARRLSMWSNADYDLLVQEAIRCDKSLKYKHKFDDDESHLVSVFTKLMLQGKVRAAVRWISEHSKGNVLLPSDQTEIQGPQGDIIKVSVLEALKMKHPDSKIPPNSAILKYDTLPLFEDVEITGGHIQYVASKIQGSAGPGGCDANHWQDALLRYGAHSEHLRDSVASLTRRLSNTIVPWDDIRSLVASRLIALDKQPGVRPIGIGETLRRLLSKTVCIATRQDIEEMCEISQLSAGIRAGIEGAIHAINDIFNEHGDEGWGVLMVDASNAFNSVNRIAALLNSRILWPRCSRFIFNTYRGWAPLVMTNSNTLLYSKEGVTQGDPLSMFIYAVGTLPLIRSLHHPERRIQVWYADDASAGAALEELKEWLSDLMRLGPSYGYYPEPKKSVLVVSSKFLADAHRIFDGVGVNIKTSHRFLGGVIGDRAGCESFVKDHIQDWMFQVDRLTTVAKTQPQVAYAAFTKSLQNKWLYMQRVVCKCEASFEDLENRIVNHLIPSIFGCEISPAERDLFSLPASKGGLSILNPKETSESSYTTSRKATKTIVQAIKRKEAFDASAHINNLMSTLSSISKVKDQQLEEKLSTILKQFDTLHQRAILRIKDEKMSSWLTVLPIAKHHFDLTAQEFRDALAIRYKKPLLGIPSKCDGCGSSFDLSHALSCRTGGLVTQRHNEVRDAFADLSAMAWNQVKREPIVKESDNDTGTPALIADLSIRGVWLPQAEALFDTRVVDTDARSYTSRSPMDVLTSAEREKRNKYTAACEERRAIFTPLCVSVDGMMGKDAARFLRRLADRLSCKWEKNYSRVIGWIRTCMSFAILRASILCLRGSRTKWRTIIVNDGSPLSLMTV